MLPGWPSFATVAVVARNTDEMVTRISCQPRPFASLFPSLCFSLSVCAAAAFNVAQQKVERACLTRSSYSAPGNFGPHLLLSLLPLTLPLSLSLCCPLSASLCGISSQADGGAASPAQSQLQLSTSSKLQQFYVPKVACNLFVVTHTHMCNTPTHMHTRLRAHSTHLISIIYDA